MNSADHLFSCSVFQNARGDQSLVCVHVWTERDLAIFWVACSIASHGDFERVVSVPTAEQMNVVRHHLLTGRIKSVFSSSYYKMDLDFYSFFCFYEFLPSVLTKQIAMRVKQRAAIPRAAATASSSSTFIIIIS